ncbi:MAG: hypothetical protein JKY96_08050 [Phycisphaerales bacterium]|nr:hypothetical protein [Phycisphaerales bacterium]
MNKLFKVISVIAILNLLGILGFAGWMFSSGRVDPGRMMEVQSLFGETIMQRDMRVAAEEKEAAELLANTEKPLPPTALTTDERNHIRVEMTQVDRQRKARTEREIENLKASLVRQQRMIDEDRVKLQAEQDAFDAMRARLEVIEGADQFAKALSVLEGLKPKDAKASLQVLLDDGKHEQVVSYLSKMDDRIRIKIFTEFIKSDNQLAAQLLESLRTRGLGAAPNG